MFYRYAICNYLHPFGGLYFYSSLVFFKAPIFLMFLFFFSTTSPALFKISYFATQGLNESLNCPDWPRTHDLRASVFPSAVIPGMHQHSQPQCVCVCLLQFLMLLLSCLKTIAHLRIMKLYSCAFLYVFYSFRSYAVRHSVQVCVLCERLSFIGWPVANRHSIIWQKHCSLLH